MVRVCEKVAKKIALQALSGRSQHGSHDVTQRPGLSNSAAWPSSTH